MGRLVGVPNEGHGFGPRSGVWQTSLRETADFKRRGMFPGGGIWAANKERRVLESRTGGGADNGEVERRRDMWGRCGPFVA